MNISKFIAGIVTDTDITATRLLTADDVQKCHLLIGIRL